MNSGRGRKDWNDPLLRPIAAASVPSGGMDAVVETTEAERLAVAKALGLAAIDALKARYRLTHRAGGAIAVSGEVEARVQPICVVSLEPFALRVREKVDVRFGEPAAETDEIDLDLSSGDDPPDPIENGVIDLGRVTTEFLSLALPMFPRKQDAAFATPEAEEGLSPFAKLAALKGGASS